MKFEALLRCGSAVSGVGICALVAIAVITVSCSRHSGEHPLARESDVDLCALLGEDVWLQLRYPAADPMVRVPQVAGGDSMVCALELDPVPSGDRFARIGRGEDANEVRTIATVTLTTTARLAEEAPQADSAGFAETLDEELRSDGWAGRELEGPWASASVYTLGEDEAATLVEDSGVVLWTRTAGVEPQALVSFTETVVQRIRAGH